jgi:hypothetical protein
MLCEKEIRGMTDLAGDPATQKPRAIIRWSARVLCWFCWAVIAFQVYGAGLVLFNAVPESRIDTSAGAAATLINFDVGMSDPAAHLEFVKGLRADWLNRIVGLTSAGLFIWAMLSARASFIGVGRGAYFSQQTSLGLRNLSIAVLLYNTVSPIIEVVPRILYLGSFKGDRMGSVAISLSMNDQIALMLIFAAVVALVASVMAHAAKLADENRQFV